jgi:serine/threonine protein kinase
MGACCARWCAYADGHSSPQGVELGGRDTNEPFVTLKTRGPKSLEKALQAASALVARHGWFSAHALPERYTMGRPLGKGAGGTVRQATRKADGLFCAVKTVPKATSLDNVEAFLREVSIMRRLDHPNVVKCVDAVDDGVFLHAVLENCAGGDLFDWFLSLPQYTEETIAGIIADIAGAVSYCHHHGVVHRDLKPENILLYKSFRGISGSGVVGSDGGATVKLCDFGCAFQLDLNGKAAADAAVLSSAQMQSLVGSSYYIAPEVLLQQGLYTAAVDLWSLGVITYLLVAGSPPFDGETEVCARARAA